MKLSARRVTIGYIYIGLGIALLFLASYKYGQETNLSCEHEAHYLVLISKQDKTISSLREQLAGTKKVKEWLWK